MTHRTRLRNSLAWKRLILRALKEKVIFPAKPWHEPENQSPCSDRLLHML